MDRIKTFKKIMEKSETDRVLILTNHYKISGIVYDCEDCNKDGFLNLTDASLCLINDTYEGESCESYSTYNYDWLHINFDMIVAFSFIKG